MCKQLLTAIGFGGTLHGWMTKTLGRYRAPAGEWGTFLSDFEDGMKTVRDVLAARHSELLRLFAEKPFPKVSLLYYLYEREERALLEKMMAAAGSAAISPEHDGLGGEEGHYEAVAAAVEGLPLSYKPYPPPYDHLKTLAPGFDWCLPAPTSAEVYADAAEKCKQYVLLSEKRVRANAVTFARYVAMQLRATTNVPHADGERRTHFEVFNCELGFWVTRHRDDLPSIISEALCNLVKPAFQPRWARGPPADPPRPLNDGKFASSLCEIVLGLLSQDPPMRELDGDHSRNKLLFSCGTVVDFEKGGARRKAVPEDRLGHRMGCPATDFAPAEPTTLFQDVEAWVKSGDPVLRNSNLGRKITEELQKLRRELSVLGVIYDFAGCWEGVVWLLRTITRMATGNPRICEFLYLFGPGASGKDVIMLLVLSFFGAGEHNYGCVLNGSFLVDGKGTSKEGPSPFLANTAGKRFVWASEVPQHKNLQVDMIKQFCEQSGAPITARKLYKAPMSFRPVGVICATSNFPPQVTHKDDTGYIRRARIWQTCQTFAVNPSKLTEVRADPSIKQRIASGEFNAQLLWIEKGLARTLTTDINPATELEPRPQFMKDIEVECAEGGSGEQFEQFVRECTEPCDRKSATPIKEFKEAVAKALGVSRVQVGPLLTAKGYTANGAVMNSTGGRVIVGFHPARGPGSSGYDGLKLKKQ